MRLSMISEAGRLPHENPYTQIALDKEQRAREMAPPNIRLPSAKVMDFLGAMDIAHGGNRAKVCTGIAHTMNVDELEETVQRLTRIRDSRVQKFVGLGAPEVIVANERKPYDQCLRILERVLQSRQPRVR